MGIAALYYHYELLVNSRYVDIRSNKSVYKTS